MDSQVKLDATFLRPNIYSFFNESSDADINEAVLFQLSRKPADLVLHQQRIQYHIKHAQPDQLFAALVDLNIVLKDKGKAFRGRMLDRSRRVLNKMHYKFLKKHLSSGLDEADPIGELKNSVLHSGIRGRTQFNID